MFSAEVYKVLSGLEISYYDFELDLTDIHEAKSVVMDWAEELAGNDRYRLQVTPGGYSGKIRGNNDVLVGMYFIYENSE